jgi:hypothetical protein
VRVRVGVHGMQDNCQRTRLCVRVGVHGMQDDRQRMRLGSTHEARTSVAAPRTHSHGAGDAARAHADAVVVEHQGEPRDQ